MELLNDMVLFVEVVKAMSFRRAADATGVPNSTLSRRISALEKAIGLRLMHRTTRRLELTEAGKIYFDRCKRIVDEAKRQGVYVAEDPRLLAMLSKLDVGQEIPQDMFTAVAVILAWVYSLKGIQPGDEKK